jgi:predicted nucleic-acid-binding protein
LVRDDEEQAEVSRVLLESLSEERPGFVCREVILEIVWVLERAYRLSRDQIAVIVEELTQTEGLIIEFDDDMIRAAMGYRQGIADFSDFMILIAAQRAGAEPLYTFDRKFSRLAGTELLSAIQKDDIP